MCRIVYINVVLCYIPFLKSSPLQVTVIWIKEFKLTSAFYRQLGKPVHLRVDTLYVYHKELICLLIYKINFFSQRKFDIKKIVRKHSRCGEKQKELVIDLQLL